MKSKHYKDLRVNIENIRTYSTGLTLLFKRGDNSYEIDIPIDIVPDLLDNIQNMLEKEEIRKEQFEEMLHDRD